MYKVVALDTRQRSGLVRTNRRARKLPALVLKSGAVIKLHPNRPVVVNQEVIDLNKKTLEDLKSIVLVSALAVKEITRGVQDVVEATTRVIDAVKEDTLVKDTVLEDPPVELSVEPPKEEEPKLEEEKPKPKKRGRKRKSRAATENKE